MAEARDDEPSGAGSLMDTTDEELINSLRDRLSALETKTVFQEQSLKEMNFWLFQHQQTIEILEGTVKLLKEKVKDFPNGPGDSSEQDQTAPHYIHR